MRSVEKTLAFLILLQQHDMKVFSLLMGGKRSFIDFKRLWSTELGRRPPAQSPGCGSDQNDVSWQPPSCAHPGKVWGPRCSHSAWRSYRNSCVCSVGDCCSELMHFFFFSFQFWWDKHTLLSLTPIHAQTSQFGGTQGYRPGARDTPRQRSLKFSCI